MPVLFAYPFRVFFLSAAAFAALSVPTWYLLLTADLPLRPVAHWHPHDMLAGFLYPAIAGFLLTAVCNWTNTRPLAGGWLVAIWLVWLVPRVGFVSGLDHALLIGLDLAFLPLVLLVALRPIALRRQWRQLPLLASLVVLWLFDLAFHMTNDPRWLHPALEAGAVLILIVGARITPAFSRSWLRAQGRDADQVRELRWLGPALLAAFTILLTLEVCQLLGRGIHPGTVAAAAFACAGLAFMRQWLWRPWLVRAEPLLWILHVGLAWVPVALLLRGLGALGLLPSAAWLHALGAGAIATMILGVMARVALGHTGRALVLPRGMLWAFLMLSGAAVLRTLASLALVPWMPGLGLAAVLWSLAFLLFLWRYAGILVSPRPDGAAG